MSIILAEKVETYLSWVKETHFKQYRSNQSRKSNHICSGLNKKLFQNVGRPFREVRNILELVRRNKIFLKNSVNTVEKVET